MLPHTGVTTLLALGCALRPISVKGLDLVLADPKARRRIRLGLLLCVLSSLALLPPMLLQELNEDGVEMLEAARSMTSAYRPSFPNDAGVLGSANPLIAPAILQLPFGLLHGWNEAAVRLPFIAISVLLFLFMCGAVESGGRRDLGFPEEISILLTIVAFSLVMGLSASYTPYHADMASPAVPDMLIVLTLLGLFYSLVRRRPMVASGFLVLGTSRPQLARARGCGSPCRRHRPTLAAQAQQRRYACNARALGHRVRNDLRHVVRAGSGVGRQRRKQCRGGHGEAPLPELRSGATPLVRHRPGRHRSVFGAVLAPRKRPDIEHPSVHVRRGSSSSSTPSPSSAFSTSRSSC